MCVVRLHALDSGSLEQHGVGIVVASVSVGSAREGRPAIVRSLHEFFPDFGVPCWQYVVLTASSSATVVICM